MKKIGCALAMGVAFGAAGCSSDEAKSVTGGHGGADAAVQGGAGGGAQGGAGGGAGTGGTGGGAGSGGTTGGTGGVDAGTDASTDGSAPEAGSSTVHGTVALGGVPIPNIPVVIDGVQHVSDANGQFTAENVPATYDAIVVDQRSGSVGVAVFEGLTTRAPFFGAGSLPGQSATVSGALSGSTFPNGTSERAGVTVFVPALVLGGLRLNAAEGPGYGPLTVGWTGSTSLDTTLCALKWSVDGNGLPNGYLGFAKKALTVTSGGSFGNSDGSTPLTNLALSAVTSRTLSGNIVVPAGLAITGKAYRVGGRPAIAIVAVNDSTTTTAYAYLVPSGLGVESTFHVFADSAANGSAHSLVRVEDSTTTLDITMLTPPIQILPIDAATGVDGTTPFTFTAMPGLVHHVEFTDAAATQVIGVYTTATQVHLPDLSSLGITFTKGATYQWTVDEDGPKTSPDELVTEQEYYVINGKRADAISPVRSFVVSTQ